MRKQLMHAAVQLAAGGGAAEGEGGRGSASGIDTPHNAREEEEELPEGRGGGGGHALGAGMYPGREGGGVYPSSVRLDRQYLDNSVCGLGGTLLLAGEAEFASVKNEVLNSVRSTHGVSSIELSWIVKVLSVY